MQKALIEFNRPKPEEDHVSIRIGLNYGQGIVRSSDVFGDVVNVASRVESVAQPEQIILSDSMYREVSASSQYPLRHAGRFAFKGKTSTHDVFEVVWNPAAVHETARAHTIVAQGAKAALFTPNFRLRHIKADGSEGSDHKVGEKPLTVGRAGDVSFASDPLLEAQHARFSVERGHLFVEDIGPATGTGVFVRIAVPWALQDGDVVMVGRQLLIFRANVAAVAAAAATGTTIVDMSEILAKPVAEMVTLAADARYPMVGDEVSFGRNKGTYVIPTDGYMSGQHARVYHRGEDFFLEDLGSRNGTFVKIRKKTPVPVDTMVRVGGQLFKVLE
jgi:pSer/pThr/pTyr-binding forkhead associated (FHA) protein